MIRYFYVVLLVFWVQSSFGQYVDSGEDPFSVDWKQINTTHFQVIFPAEFSSEAKRLSTILEKVYEFGGQSLDHQPEKVSVLLHGFSSNANAAVYWAPKRAEFNTIPPQDIYPQDWLEQLAIHEFRHVVQISKMRQGMTKLLSILLGEQGTALASAHLPFWFLEGDAVVAETALSETGRGRLPEFQMPLKAQFVEKDVFPFEKQYMGSYRDFVPDHYVLGYHMVGMGRYWYGPEIWKSAIDFPARNPYHPTAFSRGMRKVSGHTREQFYRRAMCFLDSVWTRDDRLKDTTTYKDLTSEHEVFTSYRFPQAISEDSVIALKTGFSTIPSFVLLSGGEEEVLFQPGFMDIAKLSVVDKKIVWAENNFDKRWSNRIWSDIKIYDIEKNEVKRLTRKTYYFAPELSPSGEKIVVVQATPEHEFSLVVIDSETGEELVEYQHPDNLFPITPSWSEDEDKIVMAMLENDGKKITELDLSSGLFTDLLPVTYQDISQPVYYREFARDFVLFHSTWGDKDDIFAIETDSPSVYKVTSSRFGAFDPELYKGDIYYSDYHAEGYNVVTADIDRREWQLIDTGIEDTSFNIYKHLSFGEEGVIDFDVEDVVDYQEEDYSRWKNLFNFHSWAPLYINTDAYSAAPGVSLLSQNALSTSFTSLGYRYNLGEGTGRFLANYTYKGWYPAMSLSFSYGDRAVFSNGRARYLWNEITGGISSWVPLNLTDGKYITSFTPQAGYFLTRINHYREEPESLPEGNMQIISYSAQFNHLLRTAPRDIRPRWGQVLYLNFRHSPFGDYDYGSIFSAQSSLYFPGIGRHHSLRLTGGYENRTGGEYYFSGRLTYPRGVDYFTPEDMLVFKGDYKFPLLYPDLVWSGFYYLKRVKLAVFYDHAFAEANDERMEISSMGLELTGDMHFFSIVSPVDAGVRVSYLPGTEDVRWDLLFSVSI